MHKQWVIAIKVILYIKEVHIMVKLGNSWDELLADQFASEYYLDLREFLKKEYKNQSIFPAMNHIFEAFKLTDYHDVKVVILGQDPYHGKGQAHGLAFSVSPNISIPPSLMNIYKELRDDVGTFIPNNGYLVPWAKQGVMLLNTVLTVRESSPNSHKNSGWEKLTDKAVELLNEREKPMVFMLWGKNAQEKEAFIDTKKHLVLKAAHPSPFSAHRGFFGCRHFSSSNSFLQKHDIEKIDWQIPNI